MLGCITKGRGPALILIHGVGLRAEAWEPVTPALVNAFSIYAVDMPGHGASFLGRVETLEDYVDRLHLFAAALREPVYLAGHSMGALLAIKVAARMGTDVLGLVALNAIYRRTPEAQTEVIARAEAITAGGPRDNGLTLKRWFGHGPKGAIKSARDACDTWLRSVDQQGYARAYTAFARQDGPTEQELNTITCPSLFMTGARDLNSTPAMSAAMAAKVPQGRVASVEDAAHMMPMTHPEDVSTAMIKTFQSQAPT
jgi:pimeloyl-ACP methyl ester carboxylesterase